MKISFEIASTDQHFEQILVLQKQNLFNVISQEQQREQGFVFVEHSVSLLKKLVTHLPLVIATSEGRVVGYNIAMPLAMKDDIPELVPMFAEFEKNNYKGKRLDTYRFILGGQVCVNKAFRGQKLLRQLYHETRDRLPVGYELCITEIAVRNSVSLKAHLHMGFEEISTYHDGKELWKIVVWDLRN